MDVVAVWGDMNVLGAVMNPVIPPHERVAVAGLDVRALALPVVAYKQKLPGNRVKISYRELTGPGPREWREWLPPEQTQRDDDGS